MYINNLFYLIIHHQKKQTFIRNKFSEQIFEIILTSERMFDIIQKTNKYSKKGEVQYDSEVNSQ